MRQASDKASGGSPMRDSRTANQKASTPPHGIEQRRTSSSNGDMLTSPKSDAGVRYSSYSTSFPAEKEPEERSSLHSSSMQQHLSTRNGMYETPKQPLTRKTRSTVSATSRGRESTLRQKARVRRRMGQGRQSSSGSPATNGSPEEGRPPRSSEKGISPYSSVSKQRREEQRRSRAQNQVEL